MTELLPCPWCGSDIRLSPINVPWSDNEPCWAIWHVDGTKAYEAKCPMEMGGYDTEAEAIAAWNTRAATTIGKVQVEIEPVLQGTLTAEQVREAIFNGSSYASYDGAKYYADGIGMQSIADELNAMLGGEERTCRDVSVDSSKQFYCSECECTVDVPILWGAVNYCPNCGARVIE